MLDTLILVEECLRSFVRFNQTLPNRVQCYSHITGTKNYVTWHKQVLNGLTILAFVYTLMASFYSVNWPCFDANDCAMWMVSWNHTTIAIVILISSSTYRKGKIIDCLSTAESLIYQQMCFQKQIKSRRKIGYFYFLLILLLSIKTVISISLQRSYIVYMLYSISYIAPLSMECLFMVLCSVVEDVCYQLKKNITTMNDSQLSVLLSTKLTEMIQTHQTAANLLRKINVCFDKDLAVDLVFNMIWLIIYIYVTTVALWKEWGNGRKNADLVIESFFLLVRLTFLSYSVNQIEVQTNNMLIEIRNFHSSSLNPACIELTNEFVQQLMQNDTRIKVCGLFYINMSFMRGVISLSTTYLIVFIQYGQGNESSEMKNTTKSIK